MCKKRLIMAFAAYLTKQSAEWQTLIDANEIVEMSESQKRMKAMRMWKVLTLEERGEYGEVKEPKKKTPKAAKAKAKNGSDGSSASSASLDKVLQVLESGEADSNDVAARMLKLYIKDHPTDVGTDTVGTKNKNQKKKATPAVKAEKKPPSVYNKFMQKKMGELKTARPDLDSKERMKEMAVQWKAMTAEEKEAYVA